MRSQTVIFPHPLDAWLRIFALSPLRGETRQVSSKSCCLRRVVHLLLALSI